MPALELTVAHLVILEEYLGRVLSDLSVEIAGTDRKTYRDEIKAERHLLREIAEQLEALGLPSRELPGESNLDELEANSDSGR